MKEFTYIVTDAEGLHARPAGILVKKSSGFCSRVTLTKLANGKTADAKRIFAVMGLSVKKDEEVKISIEGSDEDTAYEELLQFCQENL